MKILLVSDEESPYYWDYYQPGRLDGIDLILACGDLKADYLTFLVTMGRAPLLYVHGNHDGSYERKPPEGCQCIDGQLVTVGNLRILGLGGCPSYNGGPHQYTERQMAWRIARLALPLLRHGGADIIVTHAPIRDCGDAPDPAHRGFLVFQRLLDKLKPQYLVHGHVHLRYGHDPQRIRQYGETTVINACERYILEI